MALSPEEIADYNTESLIDHAQEEAAELIQVLAKLRKWGPNSKHPGHPGRPDEPNNITLVGLEFIQLRMLMDELFYRYKVSLFEVWDLNQELRKKYTY